MFCKADSLMLKQCVWYREKDNDEKIIFYSGQLNDGTLGAVQKKVTAAK